MTENEVGCSVTASGVLSIAAGVHFEGEPIMKAQLPRKRPKSDRRAFPVVVLHESQMAVEISIDTESTAICAAYRATMSPHEWEWTADEQAAMAQYVLWAHQRMSGIEQLVIVRDLQRAKAHPDPA